MGIEKRVKKLEQKVGVLPGEPRFIIVNIVKPDEQGNTVRRIPTEAAFEKAKRVALEKYPGRPRYFLYDFDDYYHESVTPGTLT
jgi:hypothetical protein